MKTEYFSLKIPGKTFISGEYLALRGGRSLLVSTLPGFEVFFIPKKKQTKKLDLIPQLAEKHQLSVEKFDVSFLGKNQSPAEIYFQRHLEVFNDWEILFYDGYQQKGGFGASTAQFLALYQFCLIEKNDFKNLSIEEKSLETILLEYWQCQSDLSQTSPSGNDLLAQHFAGFNIIEKEFISNNQNEDKIQNKMKIQRRSLEWKFRNLDFTLCLTGNKTPTHTHLQNLKSFDEKKLVQIQGKIEGAFDSGNERSFAEEINHWYEELLDLQLVCENTQRLVRDFNKEMSIHSSRMAIKGCGALGSDVLFILYDKSDTSLVKDWLHHHQLLTSFTSNDIWIQPIQFERKIWI